LRLEYRFQLACWEEGVYARCDLSEIQICTPFVVAWGTVACERVEVGWRVRYYEAFVNFRICNCDFCTVIDLTSFISLLLTLSAEKVKAPHISFWEMGGVKSG
jgi:hypothetical protein